MEGQHYRYELNLKNDRVLKEALYVKKARFSYLFERVWKDSGYQCKTQDFGENAFQIPQRQNASFISTALLLENALARKLDGFFRNCYGNLSYFGRDERHDPSFEQFQETAAFFQEHPDHLAWVNQRLLNFDLGLNEIVVQKTKTLLADGKDDERFFPFGIHHHNNGIFRLPLYEESRGTQALFVMLRYILPVLKSGGLAFIDEFEQGLHSHMIARLVDLFYTPKYNPHGAQLIFTCHSDYIISQLEKYQIQLVEKDASTGVSSTFRLDEIKGVRNVDNHYAKYHAGAYGGVPAF